MDPAGYGEMIIPGRDTRIILLLLLWLFFGKYASLRYGIQAFSVDFGISGYMPAQDLASL